MSQTAPVTNSPNASALQARHAGRVKSKLSKQTLSLEEGRDAVLDCIAATYYRAQSVGCEAVALPGDEEEIVKVAADIFRRRLKAHGASFEKPTAQALIAAKADADAELRF